MNKEEVENLLAIISVTYPQAARVDDTTAELNVSLWLETFIDEHNDKVMAAAALFMESPNKYPPTRADIKDSIKTLERLINNGKLPVSEYMGAYAYKKLPVKTKTYIERIEGLKADLMASLPEPQKDKGNMTKEECFKKMAALIEDKTQPFNKYNNIAR